MSAHACYAHHHDRTDVSVLAHDAGHSGVTGNYFKDRIIGTLVADWIGGLSLGWWCDVSTILLGWAGGSSDNRADLAEPQHPSPSVVIQNGVLSI